MTVNRLRLRREIEEHLAYLGLNQISGETCLSKDSYRLAHSHQREEKISASSSFLSKSASILNEYIANGSEIDPKKIDPEIFLVQGGTTGSDLFRYASLYWSIPVSEGYGRRLRFLVRDRQNDKLIGIFALGDAVFNLKIRDDYIGWTGECRRKKLVNIMDAYVVGALPPYNYLLGGKLVAALIKTREVAQAFNNRYRHATGIISQTKKYAHLTGVSVTSALGRSSIYNRLKLRGDTIFKPIGYTAGWGHFHISDSLFSQISQLVKTHSLKKFRSYNFGSGANWRLRLIREGFQILGLDQGLLRHGMTRQVFFSEFCPNFRSVLNSSRRTPDYSQLRSVKEVGADAVSRWLIPRAESRSEYASYNRASFYESLKG